MCDKKVAHLGCRNPPTPHIAGLRDCFGAPAVLCTSVCWKNFLECIETFSSLQSIPKAADLCSTPLTVTIMPGYDRRVIRFPCLRPELLGQTMANLQIWDHCRTMASAPWAQAHENARSKAADTTSRSLARVQILNKLFKNLLECRTLAERRFPAGFQVARDADKPDKQQIVLNRACSPISG